MERRGISTEPTHARQARTRALIIPREHGAWGLVLVPLTSGAAVGWAAGHEAAPVLVFAAAVLVLFWMRTPVESLLGTTPLSAQNPAERRIALTAASALGLIGAACVLSLMWGGKNRWLWMLGGTAAAAFVLQTLLKRFRSLRMSAQLVGALGLTSTAAAAYYIAAGRLDRSALGLWAANWVFAGNQIHFVHLRIHGVRAAAFAERFALGRWFFLGQVALIFLLAAVSFEQLVPRWISLAFLPMLARGFYWAVSKPAPLRIKQLGWSEMGQGVLFGVLLVVVYIASS